MIFGDGDAAAWCFLNLTVLPLLLFPERKFLAMSLHLLFSAYFTKYYLKSEKQAERWSNLPKAHASGHVTGKESSNLRHQPCALGSFSPLGISPRPSSCFYCTLFNSTINLSQLLSQHMLANWKNSNQFHMSKDKKIRSIHAAAVRSCKENKRS